MADPDFWPCLCLILPRAVPFGNMCNSLDFIGSRHQTLTTLELDV